MHTTKRRQWPKLNSLQSNSSATRWPYFYTRKQNILQANTLYLIL